MDATVSIHLASIYSSRIAGHRLRTSQCIRIRAASELVHPGYRVGDQLWTDIHVNASGAEIDLHLRLLTTPQHLGGERRWFACPNCGRRVGEGHAATAGSPQEVLAETAAADTQLVMCSGGVSGWG